MKYTILQLNTNLELVRNNHKLFKSWDMLNKCCGGFDINEYTKVYEGKIESNGEEHGNLLEVLFEQFNLRRPDDFKGHSLSVSDVVVLDGETYYCDPWGWQKVTE